MSVIRNLAAACLLVGLSQASAQAPSTLPNLDLWDHGAVFITEPDQDGHLLIGGVFTLAAGLPRANMARLLLPAGAIDTEFAPDIDGPVFSIHQQADGKILIGGLFSRVNGQTRNNIARLNADGSLDASWNPGANEAVYVLDTDGANHVVVGGSFTQIAGQARNRMARLDLAAAQVDADWAPDVQGGSVFALARTNGDFWIGGNFTQVNGQASNALAQLDANGDLLSSFDVNGNVEALSVDNSDRLYICGRFSSIDGQSRSRLARLDAAGLLEAFSIDVDQDIHDCRSAGDDILVSGQFVAINGTAVAGAARLSASGLLDVDFLPSIGGVYNGTPDSDVLVWNIRELGDQRVFVGGVFRQVNDERQVGAALLDSDTAEVQDPLPIERPAEVRVILPLADNTTLIGGHFWRSGDQPRDNVARLLGDGSLDPDWTVAVNGDVLSAGLLDDGSVLLGGFFSAVDDQARSNLARLTMISGPALDIDWSAGANAPVTVIQQDLLDSDRVYVAGRFTEIITHQAHGRGLMARLSLNDNGSPDAFNPDFALPNFDFEPQVNDILQMPGSSRLYVAGIFTQAAGNNRLGLAAFSDAGNLPQFDTDFNALANNSLWVLEAASDGESLYAGGEFTSLFGQNRQRLAKIGPGFSQWTPTTTGTPVAMALDGNGGLYVGGTFLNLNGVGRARLGRLDAANGTVDPDFNPGVTPGLIWDLALTPELVLVAGSFEVAGGQPRVGLAGFSLPLPDLLFSDRFEASSSPRASVDEEQTEGKSDEEIRDRLARLCSDHVMRIGREGRAPFVSRPGCL